MKLVDTNIIWFGGQNMRDQPSLYVEIQRTFLSPFKTREKWSNYVLKLNLEKHKDRKSVIL